MTKNRIVLAIGIILFLMPLLGFTTYQKNFFLLVCGATLVGLSFSTSLKKRKSFQKIRKPKGNPSSSVFVDGHGPGGVSEVNEVELGETESLSVLEEEDLVEETSEDSRRVV